MLSEADIENFRERAATNALEVEDVLQLAAIGDPQGVSLLQELKRQHQWSTSGFENGVRVVPFARWADVVCVYLHDGYDGLVSLAVDGLPDRDAIYFPVAVL
ncbi:MAG: hypothetical protein IH831_04595 [Planctomycetes bacterium]|nr:hypothetical protein [Planctomycetota bacterium]